ncbi:MAG: Hsp20/alpha crystallin family protein [Candidatus Hydrogenedentes bacterium]|nr:Hsp20/alpha crystallin family protein [Candidatus Hydrogenedentota bacterium]
MSEQAPSTTPAQEPRPRRSRALIGFMGALALAVCIQGVYMWHMHGQLQKAISASDGSSLARGWSLLGQEGKEPSKDQSSGSLQTPNFSGPIWQPFDANTWDPSQEMARMRAEMDQMFNQAMGRFQNSPQFGGLSGSAGFSPSSDLTDEGDRYVVRIDVPGASEHDIQVKIEGQMLTISGTRSDTQEQSKDGKILRQERTIGQFHRSMTLPEPVDEDAMTTTYENGVFTVTLPKLHGSSNQPSGSVRGQ